MVGVEDLSKLLLSGDRIALGKAITIVESNKSSDRALANELLKYLLPHTGKAIRIGITGVPGVGKSTFIEAIGELITSHGKKLAVLAVDPSSPSSKGSILGDKTRMSNLATNANAFIRPSAAAGQLGGVANKTMEAILLCEAAGYDVIMVETVGVGQSEIAVKNMTDIFLLLMLAGAGDELQGIKRGIMEMADILVINKADGENSAAANLAQKTYQNALHLLAAKDSGWETPVLTASALNKLGIAETWDQINSLYSFLSKKGLITSIREGQKKHWFNEILGQELHARIRRHPEYLEQLLKLESDVIMNRLTPYQASGQILDQIISKN